MGCWVNMKKVFLISGGLLSLFLFMSCNKNGTSSQDVFSDLIQKKDTADKIVQYEDLVFEDYEPISDIFELDYRPELPEPESIPRKVNITYAKGNEKDTENHIPRLRKLSEYETDYSVNKDKNKRFSFLDEYESQNADGLSLEKDTFFEKTDINPAEEKKDSKSEENTDEFNEPVIFQVERASDNTSSLSDSYSFYIRFSEAIDKATVEKAFTFINIEKGDEWYDVFGSSLYVTGMKVKPGDRGIFTINTELKSVSGNSLDKEFIQVIAGRDYPGYARYTGYGHKMLESQFSPKLIMEHRNALNGGYYKINNFDSSKSLFSINSFEDMKETLKLVKRNELLPEEKNKRHFDEIDLKPYLTDGKGWLTFESEVPVAGYDWKGNPQIQTEKNWLSLQVTDLGASVRYAQNKILVLVTNLSSGKPVQGAVVKAVVGLRSSNEVKTGADGLAVIDLRNDYNGKFFTKRSYEESLIIDVVAEKDHIRFIPEGHNSYRSGVWSMDPSEISEAHSKIFMFTDRGVYKPGETVTFKGIHWNLKNGSYKAFANPYTVTLKSAYWGDKNVYATIPGTCSVTGGFHGSVMLPDDIKPGRYMFVYESASSNENLYFTVADFEDLRIQGNVNLQDKEIFTGDKLEAEIFATYLSGGNVAGGKYSANLYTQSTRFTLKDDPVLNKYTYGSESSWDSVRNIAHSNGKLDMSGRANLSFDTGNELKAGTYIYKVDADISDNSEDNVHISASKIVHPASFYVGLKKNYSGFAKKNQSVSFEAVLVTPSGEMLLDSNMVSGEPEFQLIREYWTYDYQNGVNDSVNARYTRHEEVETSGKIRIKGQEKIDLIPKNSGSYILRVSAFDKQNRNTFTDYKFYVTGSGYTWWTDGDEQSIRLTPDKNMYVPGETAQILLESPLPKGAYLVTVEREGIFSHEIINLDEPTTVLNVKIARNFVPVVYVSVSSYSVRSGEPTHEYGQKDFDKPKCYYGVTKVLVNPRVRAFSVDVKFNKEIYEPGDRAVVTFTATKAGKPLSGAELTVMGVDRAVLDQIDYHVPNPVDFFYNSSNFPLGVRGGDSRIYLIDPVTYSIKNLQGGDAADEKDDLERKNFKPTAFFEPSLITGEDGKVQYTFTVPDNLTTYRLTTFGINDELVALQEDEFIVQKKVNVHAVQPKVLRTRDTARVGVTLTNLDSELKNLIVRAEIRSPEGNLNSDESRGLITDKGQAFFDGISQCEVKVSAGNTAYAFFDLACVESGVVEIHYEVIEKDNHSGKELFYDALVSRVKIEKPYIRETMVKSGVVKAGSDESVNVTIPSFSKGTGNVSITLDATRLGLLNESVDYLFDYPFGCMEQQTSRVLPLIIFGKYIDVLDMKSKVSSPYSAVKSFTQKWGTYQNEDGGFGYWSDSKQSHYYVSLRVCHVLGYAQKNGFKDKDIPVKREKLVSYIVNNLPEDGTDYAKFLRMYAVYVLNLLGDSSLDSLLKEEYLKTSDVSAKIYAALSYAAKYECQQNEEDLIKARVLLKDISKSFKPDLRSVYIDTKLKEKWYHREAAVYASALQLYSIIDSDNEMTDKLLFTLLSKMRAGYWCNTDTTIKVLEAINAYIKGRNLENLDLSAYVELNDAKIAKGKFKGVGANPVSFCYAYDSEIISALSKDTEIPLSVFAKGKGDVNYVIKNSFYIPEEFQTEVRNGMEVSFDIFDVSENRKVESSNGVIALKSGNVYRMNVHLKSLKDRQFVAVRIPVPSGAQILDKNLASGGQDGMISSGIVYRDWSSFGKIDIMANEVQYFIDDYEAGKEIFQFTFRANDAGVYPTPSITCECMYEPEINGRSEGCLYTIE